MNFENFLRNSHFRMSSEREEMKFWATEGVGGLTAWLPDMCLNQFVEDSEVERSTNFIFTF